MNTSQKFLLLLPVVLVLSACTLYRQIPIEVLRTEEVVFPLKSPALTLVYRNFKFSNDTLQNRYLQDGVLLTDRSSGKNETDSLVVAACLNSVAGKLKEESVSNQPVFYPFDIFPPQTGERIIPLPAELVRKMAMPARADYLIVLETITYFFSINNGMAAGEGFQQVKLAAVWNLYSAETGKVEDHKTVTDTLFWDLDKSSGNSGVTPPRLVALQQAAAYLGENYAKRFYSEWEKVERMLIIPPLEDFRQAAELAGQQEWDKASGIWNRYTAEKYGRLAISACYNMALSSEISDELALAKKWIDQAVRMASAYRGSDELEYAIKYQKILASRISGIEKITGKRISG